MAQLITTQAEKDAVSFLDWDDASLGRMCKNIALMLHRARAGEIAKGKKDDDIGAVINAADGMLLIGSMVECNAGTLTLKFGDVTHKGEPAGDWELRMRQLSKPKTKK
jgi:hypothetical protein